MEFHSKILKELEKEPDPDMQWLSSLLPLLKEIKKKLQKRGQKFNFIANWSQF
uniref:Uncharacterized protein n=1 Tax=Timema monikensis TaxID=170555 RepID=A0A7R9HV20_9NEOP|nr:unnamed protein product [Timema monikensis]